MKSISEIDNGRSIELRVGEAARIVLPENASTGYRWAVDHVDGDVLEAGAPESRYPPNVAGSAGEVVLPFTARQPGSGEIRLKCWRSWEGAASVRSRFAVTVHVKAAGG